MILYELEAFSLDVDEEEEEEEKKRSSRKEKRSI